MTQRAGDSQGCGSYLENCFLRLFQGREGLGGLEYLVDGPIFLAVVEVVLRVIEYFVDSLVHFSCWYIFVKG